MGALPYLTPEYVGSIDAAVGDERAVSLSRGANGERSQTFPVNAVPPELAGIEPASSGIIGMPDGGPFGVTLSPGTAETVTTVLSSPSLPLFPDVLPLFLAFPRAGDRSIWTGHVARRLLAPDRVRPELLVATEEVGVVNK